jgi:hypothetical protein
VNVRADYTDASAGTYYGVAGGDRDQLGALTGTFDYNLWENVQTRVELRWDHAMGGDKPFGGGPGHGTQENALTLAFNAIYKF